MSALETEKLAAVYRCVISKEEFVRNYLLTDDVPPEAVECMLHNIEHSAELINIINNQLEPSRKIIKND